MAQKCWLESLNSDHSLLAINCLSFRRFRRTQRKALAQEMQVSYAPNASLVVHWDENLLPDCDKEKVDRLPVIVTDPRRTAKLPAGTGQTTANAVVQCLNDWKLSGKVVGMSFDTTSTNTGSALGSCTILQQKLRRTLFHFACCHHILEPVAEAAFRACFSPPAGPDMALFKHFQSSVWNSTDQTRFESLMPGDLDSVVGDAFLECKKQLVSFWIQKLKSAPPVTTVVNFSCTNTVCCGYHKTVNHLRQQSVSIYDKLF